MSTEAAVLPKPTQNERKNAMLAHVLQVFAGILPALLILLKKRESKFVRFHAFQVMLWQGLLIVLTTMAMVGFFVTLPFVPRSPIELPVTFYVFSYGSYLLLVIHWIITVCLAISFGVKSHHGDWARYPVIGEWAAKWSRN